MAATVAHEINNPVEAVSNILYLLENSTQLDDTARQFVRAAQTELRRIGQITKLTLGFCRGGEHRKTQVRITELIDDVLTTGTTARECARVLRQAGAERIFVATVARVFAPESRLELTEVPVSARTQAAHA